jgi:RNA polymerase sigma factor (TIGR02999 family)
MHAQEAPGSVHGPENARPAYDPQRPESEAAMPDRGESRSESPMAAEIAELLRQLSADTPGTLSALIVAAQHDLRRIAHRERVAFGPGETLSTTALVNEAYLRLSHGKLPQPLDRRYFFGIASRAMRQILVEHARAHSAQKRGGGAIHTTLSAAEGMPDPALAAEDLLVLDDALSALEEVSVRAAEIVYLRYFGGLTDAEIGALLDIDQSTVRRDWSKARGWLYRRMTGPPDD